nr:hypothetical protein [Tanacetum cinerariifolium]
MMKMLILPRNEEMVADLRYFNSLEFKVDSLRSQLEIQKTQFSNEIDRLSREYYYADHMNAILGVYTELDEVTNLQCDYLELLQKCECLETKVSKSKMMSKSFESIQKNAINLELELQQCKEKVKNDMSFKVNKSKDFCKEREQCFKIQDLKAQLQDKGIVISELKKLIEKLKGNSVNTKFEKSSGLNQFLRCLNEEMVADLRYFNSLESEVDSLRSQLETQRTQFLNEIDRLSKEYYYADHMNAILGVIPTTCVRRPRLKSNPMGDRALHSNSRGKKLEVEEHHRNVKLPKNKTSVTACNDNLNA